MSRTKGVSLASSHANGLCSMENKNMRTWVLALGFVLVCSPAFAEKTLVESDDLIIELG